MTVTEQVESLSRAVAELRDKEQAAAREEIWRRLSEITRDLGSLTDHAVRLYEAASVLAPESAEMAVEIWDHLYKNFAIVSNVLERIQKACPGLVETQRETLRDLVQKSAIAILEWDVQAEGGGRRIPSKSQEVESLVLVPNDETVAAIEEGKRNDLKSFNTVAELMADLNAED